MKHPHSLHPPLGLYVAPCAGAWIETSYLTSESPIPFVAPCAGAWIETAALTPFKGSNGEARAEYGTMLLKRLVVELTARFGRGFDYSNLNLFRQFYLTYQERKSILQSAIEEFSFSIQGSPAFKLSWTHYIKRLPISDSQTRNFDKEEAFATVDLYVNSNARWIPCFTSVSPSPFPKQGQTAGQGGAR